jgi:hypothetical protein
VVLYDHINTSLLYFAFKCKLEHGQTTELATNTPK